LLHRARARQQAAYRQGRPCFRACLDELVARFWLGQPVVLGFAALAADAGSDLDWAMAELAHGQLLMSRRLPGARGHLRAGFAAGRDAFPPRAFFEVLHRHELLAHLPPLSYGGEPATLHDLLVEAAVVRRLETALGHCRPAQHDPTDTLG
jgi:hypothetical protein